MAKTYTEAFLKDESAPDGHSIAYIECNAPILRVQGCYCNVYMQCGYTFTYVR